MEKKPPERHNEIRDPKLPVIHGQAPHNRAENHLCQGPIPQTQSEL